MSDIVERLRRWHGSGDTIIEDVREAADEIERLRVEYNRAAFARMALEGTIKDLKTEIERLKAALRDEREQCATVALQQQCERGTPWDLACTTIAEKIRASSRPRREEGMTDLVERARREGSGPIAGVGGRDRAAAED